MAENGREAMAMTEGGGSDTPEELYLDLLKKCLTRSLSEPFLDVVVPGGSVKWHLFAPVQKLLSSRGIVLARPARIGPEVFAESPPQDRRVLDRADTLIGPWGLDNIHHCIREVMRARVPGDLIETGVWRGGATIFMRGALKAYGDRTRIVWAADSFAGLPEPDPKRYPKDAGETKWSKMRWLAVSLEEVKRNFARYGLLDDQIRFLVGWFHETLATAPIEQLAVLRLDGDMYGSTMDALRYLYPKLSVGGYVIVDDYWLPGCREAVDEYRAEHGITEEIVRVDRAIVFWQRL